MNNCRIRITYNQNLSLINLSNIIELISKGFNDVCRNHTKNQRVVSKANPKIENVEKGSIVIDLLLDTLLTVATDVTIHLIVEHIKERISKSKNKINVEIKDEEINIHIEN